MTDCVVDPSAAAGWLVTQPWTVSARRLLSDAYCLHAPDFFLLEMDSVICKWIRRRLITGDEGAALRQQVWVLPIRYHSFLLVEHEAYTLALVTGGSPYDCLYLALAIRLDAIAVTADQRFVAAVRNTPYGHSITHVDELPEAPGCGGRPK